MKKTKKTLKAAIMKPKMPMKGKKGGGKPC